MSNSLPLSKSAMVDKKCDSAPVSQMNTEIRPTLEPSLSLSSPRLMRRHHKQDCLLTETLLHNQSKKLPYFKTDDHSSSPDQLELPEYSLRRQRRPSLSLPDLRNVSSCLINSGNSTPTTDGGSGSRASSPTPEIKNKTQNYDDDDDVFSSSYPTAILTGRKHDKITFKTQLSEKQGSLPEINKGIVTLTTPRTIRKGINSLVKQRKYSTSDDQLNKQVVL